MIDLSDMPNGTHRLRTQVSKKVRTEGGKKPSRARSKKGMGPKKRAALVIGSVAAGLVLRWALPAGEQVVVELDAQ